MTDAYGASTGVLMRLLTPYLLVRNSLLPVVRSPRLGV